MNEGDEFEGYVVRARVGEGGMAEVFRGERRGAHGISRDVCIKRMKRELSNDPTFAEMFTDEARIASTLRHGNIVAVEHFGRLADGSLFMVMEWVHGVDAQGLLRRVHREGQRLPVDVALYVVFEVLRALEYAHRKTDGARPLEIVHRDVSPHNVLVSFEGDVKLTDFGVARATSRVHHTAGHVVKGKIEYMAPEQITGHAVDARADLWAVGVTAFQLLTGRLPFRGDDPLAIMRAQMRGERQRLRALRPEVPAEVEAIVDRLLCEVAAGRYASAGKVCDTLARVPTLLAGGRALRPLLREWFAGEAFSTLHPGSFVEEARAYFQAMTTAAAPAAPPAASPTAPSLPSTRPGRHRTPPAEDLAHAPTVAATPPDPSGSFVSVSDLREAPSPALRGPSRAAVAASAALLCVAALGYATRRRTAADGAPSESATMHAADTGSDAGVNALDAATSPDGSDVAATHRRVVLEEQDGGAQRDPHGNSATRSPMRTVHLAKSATCTDPAREHCGRRR